MIDPNSFVISRKRKKYRFAKFANADNCFEIEEWDRRSVDVIEIGAGTGLFSLELAKRYPKKHFVALDIKGDRLQKGAYLALEQGVTNVSFVRARADQIDDLFQPGSVHTIWVTFPDPFPKKGSAGRRLTHPQFLKKYAQLLTRDGSLCLKHDNPAFFQWSLEQLVQERWHLKELSFNIHDSNLHDDYKIITTYEERWIEEGRISQFVRAALRK